MLPETGRTEASPSEKLCWTISRGKLGFGNFHPLALHRAFGRSMASEYILVQTVMFVLSVSQPGTLSCQHSTSNKTDYQLLGQPHEMSELWLYDTILSFSVYAEAESRGVFS